MRRRAFFCATPAGQSCWMRRRSRPTVSLLPSTLCPEQPLLQPSPRGGGSPRPTIRTAPAGAPRGEGRAPCPANSSPCTATPARPACRTEACRRGRRRSWARQRLTWGRVAQTPPLRMRRAAAGRSSGLPSARGHRGYRARPPRQPRRRARESTRPRPRKESRTACPSGGGVGRLRCRHPRIRRCTNCLKPTRCPTGAPGQRIGALFLPRASKPLHLCADWSGCWAGTRLFVYARGMPSFLSLRRTTCS